MWKILVTEAVHEAGLKILSSDPEVNLTQRIGMSREELRPCHDHKKRHSS
jgi:D-3-phosphoglycerate dehydrogenase